MTYPISLNVYSHLKNEFLIAVALEKENGKKKLIF